MSFTNLAEQKRVVSLLKGIATHGRIANGYLFTGPESSGQKEAALAFAQLVNCQAPQEGDSCGECPSCRKVQNENLPDLIQIGPSGAKIKKEQIKSLADRTKYGPYECKWLFVIIEKAELMTEEAANSFLKLLEEPAERTTFILITFNEDALLSTIVSRCQRVSFNYLEQALEVDRKEAEAVTFDLVNLLSSAKGNLVMILAKAEEIAKDKDTALKACSKLLESYKETKQFEKAQLVLSCCRKLKYNVNVRLCLEAMLLRVISDSYGN